MKQCRQEVRTKPILVHGGSFRGFAQIMSCIVCHVSCRAALALALPITSTDSVNRWLWEYLQAVSARSAN